MESRKLFCCLDTVCYKEANPDQFDAFIDEVQQEGRLTGETKELLKKLEEDPTKKEESKEEVKLIKRNQIYRK